MYVCVCVSVWMERFSKFKIDHNLKHKGGVVSTCWELFKFKVTRQKYKKNLLINYMYDVEAEQNYVHDFSQHNLLLVRYTFEIAINRELLFIVGKSFTIPPSYLFKFVKTVTKDVLKMSR